MCKGFSCRFSSSGGFYDFKVSHPNMCEWQQQQQQTQQQQTQQQGRLMGISSNKRRGPASLHLDFNKRNGERNGPVEDLEGDEDSRAPVEILPFLYLGNEAHCACKEVLQKLGITAVMNVSKTITNHFQDHFVYKNVPVDDTYNADISRWFRVAVDFIGKTTHLFSAFRHSSTETVILGAPVYNSTSVILS